MRKEAEAWNCSIVVKTVARNLKKFSVAEINANLSGMDGWTFDGHQITKIYTFDCYQKGLVFATHVGLLADQMDHHPDITIGYQKVKVSLNTHDVDGISELDFVLARKLG